MIKTKNVGDLGRQYYKCILLTYKEDTTPNVLRAKCTLHITLLFQNKN